MNKLRNTALAAAVLAASLVAPAAHADLILTINGSQVGSTDPSNTSASLPSSISVGGWTISDLGLAGVNAFGGNGELLDARSFSVSATGASAGTVTLAFTETNLTGTGVAGFNLLLTNILNNASVTSKIYADSTNQGYSNLANDTVLASVSHSSTGIGASIDNLVGFANLSGSYSLTEVVSLTANGAGANLSSDDAVSVPEPAVLSLLGLGLSAVAFLRRRK